jgi:hypothetical protein
MHGAQLGMASPPALMACSTTGMSHLYQAAAVPSGHTPLQHVLPATWTLTAIFSEHMLVAGPKLNTHAHSSQVVNTGRCRMCACNSSCGPLRSQPHLACRTTGSGPCHSTAHTPPRVVTACGK